jgi:hypothetical protein
MGKPGVGTFKRFLNSKRTVNSVNGALKFRQHVVTDEVNNPALVSADEIGHLIPIRCQRPYCGHLIFGHEAAISDGISAQNCRKPMFKITVTHLKRPPDNEMALHFKVSPYEF